MDFSKNSPKSEAFLSQNKIPSDMIASYHPQGDYDTYSNDYQHVSYDQSQAMMSQYNSYFQYQIPYYESFIDPMAPFTSKFPRARNYHNLQSIAEAFPHLQTVNDANFNYESISPNAQFYILRSVNDDNIHKAIKYHMWATTVNGKNVLKQAWQEFESKGLNPEIYLVFSVVNSNQFLGVAKMISTINNDNTFKYWWEPCKWFGTFQLQWLFVKDIHHSKFEHIKEGNYSTSIISSRDSTPISAESGKLILKTFLEHPNSPSIFESFEYMDRREDLIRTQRDNDSEFQQYFDECCAAYQQDPEGFQPQKRTYHGRKSGRKTRANFSHRKYHGNHYYAKTYYYKKNENNNTEEQPKNEEQPQNTKPISLEEQFIVKTENKKSKKGSNSKGKKNFEGKSSEPYYPVEGTQNSGRNYEKENFNFGNVQHKDERVESSQLVGAKN